MPQELDVSPRRCEHLDYYSFHSRVTHALTDTSRAYSSLIAISAPKVAGIVHRLYKNRTNRRESISLGGTMLALEYSRKRSDFGAMMPPYGFSYLVPRSVVF
ncbi:hypothetical protein [Paraburkholderia unamae]|uniref:Uncharacterized protein n=1 Tax=Paraburkholderia unamae TaxID=219649 RepID=A0ACC6RKL6_9BURK